MIYIKKQLFSELLKKFFWDDVFDNLANYIDDNDDNLLGEAKLIKEIDEHELVDMRLKSSRLFDVSEEEVKFYIIVESDIAIYKRDRHFEEEELINQWYMIIGTLNIFKVNDSFTIESITEYTPNMLKELGNFESHPLDDSLIPIIDSNNYDKTISEILSKYYPEALKKTDFINLETLSERVGITILGRRISEDSSIFGQTYFKGTEVEFYDEQGCSFKEYIEEGTVVYDPNVLTFRNLGSINNTIAHEIMHWILHRKSFELHSFSKPELTRMSSLAQGDVRKLEEDDPTQWMERQASSLAPKLLMPKKIFLEKTHEYVKFHQERLHTMELPFVLESVIESLSIFFQVSKVSAKIRLLECGYLEVLGVMNYVDGSYVRPHGFEENSIAKNQTFTLSINDVLFLSATNQEFRAKLESDNYKFVENHMVINSPDYIQYTLDGKAELTNYALLHMNECCLVFDIEITSSYKNQQAYYIQCILCRAADSNIKFEVNFSTGNINSKEIGEKYSAYLNDIEILISKLPRSYGRCLDEIIDWSDLTRESIALEAGISVRTLQRHVNNQVDSPPIGTVVALCVAMQLPSPISFALIDSAGHSLTTPSKRNIILSQIITGYSIHAVDECNLLLESNGFESLTRLK